MTRKKSVKERDLKSRLPCLTFLAGNETPHHAAWLVAFDKPILRVFARNLAITGGLHYASRRSAVPAAP